MGNYYTCKFCGEEAVLKTYDDRIDKYKYACFKCGGVWCRKRVEIPALKSQFDKVLDGAVENAEDNVNHPKHYTKGKYECLDVIKDICKDLAGVEAFLVANIIKYIWRFNTKNGLEDLKKARFYLEELIQKKEE